MFQKICPGIADLINSSLSLQDKKSKIFELATSLDEYHCFKELMTSEDRTKLIMENPELGTIVGNDEGIALKPDVNQATIRMFATLDGAPRISVGTINCFALEINGAYNYYDHYVIGHTPPTSIEALLGYAETQWERVIYGLHENSASLLDALARTFWAQTIATPYQRGSESLAKWMLTLTARYHRQELVYTRAFAFRMPFAMDIEEFVNYFKENATLKSELAAELD